MNNKGFAITGILYTIMILFFLILISILASLSSRNNLLKKSVESLENKFIGTSVEITDDITEAPITGKYKFILTLSSGENIECYSYLKKGREISNQITFTTNECNSNKETSNINLINIYELNF